MLPQCFSRGAVISLGAADLLREAAGKLEVGEKDLSQLRNEWFDALAGQVPLVWRNWVTYHVLALKQELPFRPSHQGWRERRWVDLPEIRRLGRDRPQGHTAFLLGRGLEEAIARAAGYRPA